ncbi:TPA: IS66 family transposase [Salmonella enterica subsp. salamae]|nr:IS66 family transposase [Salmonella enterica subsp. salamae]
MGWHNKAVQEIVRILITVLYHSLTLSLCCEDGRVELDNNIAENTLRCVALGRRNWLFFGSDTGGQIAAILYSMLATYRLNGVDPESWLREVISCISEWPSNRVEELLPWNLVL